MSLNRVLAPSFLLFIDQFLTAALGWIYWLMISRISNAADIGVATTVYSIVVLISAVTALGIEYSILKRASTDASRVLTTSLVIELAIMLAAIPLVFIVIDFLYNDLHSFSILASALLVSYSLSFIPRFFLLGISNAKGLLIIDTIGIGLRFLTGFMLLSLAFGITGIILSFVVQMSFLTVGSLFLAKRLNPWKMGNRHFVKTLTIEGLVNTPSKLSRIVILNLGIIFLAFMGINNTEIGVFYMALMISVVAGGLASSMALMILPASSSLKSDLSADSIRLGLSLTTPLIVLLMTIPTQILTIVGKEYASADLVLQILAITILPSTVAMNTVSKLNNKGESKRLVILGCTEITAFLITFLILVPSIGTVGAALSMLSGFGASSILSVIWSGKKVLKYYAISALSVIGGFGVGLLAQMLVSNLLVTITLSLATTIGIILIFKNTSISELKLILVQIRK